MTQLQAQAADLGEALYIARRRRKLTQKDVAEKLGVSRPQVSRWESGDSVPDAFEFRMLVELYAADWLWDALQNWKMTLEDNSGIDLCEWAGLVFA